MRICHFCFCSKTFLLKSQVKYYYYVIETWPVEMYSKLVDNKWVEPPPDKGSVCLLIKVRYSDIDKGLVQGFVTLTPYYLFNKHCIEPHTTFTTSIVYIYMDLKCQQMVLGTILKLEKTYN